MNDMFAEPHAGDHVIDPLDRLGATVTSSGHLDVKYRIYPERNLLDF